MLLFPTSFFYTLTDFIIGVVQIAKTHASFHTGYQSSFQIQRPVQVQDPTILIPPYLSIHVNRISVFTFVDCSSILSIEKKSIEIVEKWSQKQGFSMLQMKPLEKCRLKLETLESDRNPSF